MPGGFEQTLQTPAHRLVVVHDADKFRGCVHALSPVSDFRVTGRLTRTEALVSHFVEMAAPRLSTGAHCIAAKEFINRFNTTCCKCDPYQKVA
jgi:hypothetical protein